MLKYNIVNGTNNSKIIIVSANDLQRYALHDSTDTPLEFKQKGGQAVAVAHGNITIYRKPTGLTFHKEYMLHNARSLWLGFYPDFTRLSRNLYEYEQTI